MMPPTQGAMELAHARVSARFGALPEEAVWARLASLRDPAMLIDALRGSGLARWVRGIASGAGVHAIETAVRRAWRDEVVEVASWMPPSWQDAVLWWSTWLDLALLQHVARGAGVPAWLAADPVYQESTAGVPRVEASHLRDARAMLGADREAVRAWMASWQHRCAKGEADAIGDVARLLIRARTSPAGIGSSKPSIGARRRALVLLFRRNVLEPAAAFCYLAILAIDLERLRGELVRSVVFARRGGRA